MKIYLYLEDKIISFQLPKEIEGSYNFDENLEEESKLINIEARDNAWYLYSTEDSSVIADNNIVPDVLVRENTFYILRRNEKNYLILISNLKSQKVHSYTYNKNLELMIGNNQQCNIIYNCEYLQGAIAKIYFNNNQLIIERLNKINIYINNKSLHQKNQYIKPGDKIDIYGLKLIFLPGLILITTPIGKTEIIENSAKIETYFLAPGPAPEKVEIKDVDLYDEKDYFSKSPRIRRTIETKTIKLSPPPRPEGNQELPMILTVGPMFTMGIMALVMLVNTANRIYIGDTTLAESWPQLVTSGAMLISMLVWPVLTKIYNNKMKERKRKEIIEKYSKYLEEKKAELISEQKLQKEILIENLISIRECLNIIQNKTMNFWDKRIDQSDFLVVRLGVGDDLLDVKVEYPEEGFTIEEDELRKKADAMVKEFKYIENVPIGYSLYENTITAIMGDEIKCIYFTNNIILQLITFYSYEDLKIIVFTNEDNKSNWNYIKYLNHNFTNDKRLRFFASTVESTKTIAEYLNTEVNNRLAQQSSDERNTPPKKPHYIIVTDDYNRIKRYDFIKQITETENNIGFSVLILEERLSKLPSKCNNFISLGTPKSGVLKNSYEKQEQIAFYDEIDYTVNMMNVAKIESNIPIEFEDGVKQLPDAITFLEMEKAGKVEQLNILNRWNTNDSTTSLKAEVGVDEEGDLMYLDLHEKFHGPHGLIAGMTGSGKSEFIITYILSMAINYSPDDVSFILIDYKGGGLAFAFENKATGKILPHLAGTITNLDKAEMDRTLVSIDSEIKRRQKIFNEARDELGESTIDIYKYQRYFKEGRIKEPVPHLFIICDEFAELKSQQPEFMDNLISVARIGRSLGVHLILATQKPSGVVNDQIWTNTKFRVCLKVQDEQDSREMLKRPEAASIKQTGRFYLQVGYDEYFALGQSGWCGAKYYPSEKIVKQVDKSINFLNDCGLFIKSIQAATNTKVAAQGEQLSAIMNSIIEVAHRENKRARRLWLENLSDIILEKDLESKYHVEILPYQVEAIIGEYDAPEQQLQGIEKYNFLEKGNTIIYGNDGSEREMLLDTIIYSSTKNHSSKEINYYTIDYGSEALRRYEKLPHVGGMVTSGEDEKYHNLLKLIKNTLKERKKLFSNYGGEYQNYINNNEKIPLQVIIMNNYDSIYEMNPELYDELPDLIRDSERYGIIFIITANTINSVQSKIAQNCPNTYAYKMKDTSDYTSIFGQRVKNGPRETKGRGLLKNEGVHEFQTVSIVEEEADLNDYIMEFVKEQQRINTTKAKRIPVLPEKVGFEDIEEAVNTLKDIPIGISKKELEICTVDYQTNLGNVISSNRIANTEPFIKSLLLLLNNISNCLLIIDPIGSLKLNEEQFPNYYTQDMKETMKNITDYITKLKEQNSTQTGIIIIYGIAKFISKLASPQEMTTLTNLIKSYEKISLVIVDDASKIKQLAFESWFNGLFSLNDGIWIGKGIADQNLLHLSTINKEMMEDYKNNMAYLVSENRGVLLKVIDFTSNDKGEDNEK